MDYSITESWWISTPRINQTDRITPQYTFLPNPMEWFIPTRNTSLEPTTPTDQKMFLPTRPSYPFDIENDTPRPRPSLPEPWYKQYPYLTPPPIFPSDNKYPTICPYASIPSPTGPTPEIPSFTLPKVERSKWTFLTEYPPRYVLDRVSSSTTPRFEYTSTTRDSLPPYGKKWQQELMPSYAAADSSAPTNMEPMLSQVFNYDYPNAVRRILKINSTQDSGSSTTVELKSSVFEDQTQFIPREEITVAEKKETTDSEFEHEASSYDPDIKKTTPRKNESKVLSVLKMISTKPKGERQLDPTVTTTPSTVKEFLLRMSNSDSYFKMIETLHEGYMMVFLIELTRLVATKERKAVRDVVKHTDQIIYGFYRSGQLLWSRLLIDVTTKVARLLKESKIDVIQNHAANLHHMLSQRHQELSVEVNTILEYADTLYDDDEGRLLFDALKQFAAYPNISLTGYWLCNSLINNFLRPYRRLKDTQQRQKLIDSVNLELKTRLTWSVFKEEPPLRDSDAKKADGSPDETKLLTQTEPEAQKEPNSNSTWSPRERKRKRHHRSRKRKRERKRSTYTDLT